jgi:hypothetical protein
MTATIITMIPTGMTKVSIITIFHAMAASRWLRFILGNIHISGRSWSMTFSR